MLLEILKAGGLGVVEGLTEFLPISSTGHLILVNQWLSFDAAFTYVFDVVIQLGAIAAVVGLFWQRLWPLEHGKIKKDVLHLWFKVAMAVLPALILGGLLGSVIEEKLFNPLTVALALAIGGAILIVIEMRTHDGNIHRVEEVSYSSALMIGLFQCLALIPGTSRSAATIIGALVLGVSRKAAAEFSFFLAIPTLAAASAYSLLKHGTTINRPEVLLLIIGFVTAFVSAWIIVGAFLRYIQHHNFKVFGYYRIILAMLVLAILYWQ